MRYLNIIQGSSRPSLFLQEILSVCSLRLRIFEFQDFKFHSQCIHTPLNSEIEMNVISRNTYMRDFLLKGEYQCTFTKVMSIHE